MLQKIERFKREANRPNSLDFDVEKLINACGGDVVKAVSLVKEDEQRKLSVMTEYAIRLGQDPHDAEERYTCHSCGYCFGDWNLYSQSPNAAGTKDYCPRCKSVVKLFKSSKP